MKGKIKNVVLVILVTQVLIACCREKTYEVTITGIESRSLISDGSNSIVLDKQNSIDKDKLIIDVDFTELEVIVSSESTKIRKVDIEILEAAVVPCADDVVIFKNGIESIKVEVLDVTNNNKRIDITNQLVIVGTQTSISEYISQYDRGIGNFWIKLSDTTNIPAQIVYEIEATLNDGAKIESSDGIIKFN